MSIDLDALQPGEFIGACLASDARLRTKLELSSSYRGAMTCDTELALQRARKSIPECQATLERTRDWQQA